MIASIYCSGSIQKGPNDTGKLCWSDVERGVLAQGASPLDIKFLCPDDPAHDLSDTASLFGRDMYQIQVADYVVVDARERRGIGIGVEMVAAKILGAGLVFVLPSNTYYRKSNLSYRGSTVEDYIHPHIALLADVIVDDFQSAGNWIKQHFHGPKELKSTDVIHDAIETYKKNMLPFDPPMIETLAKLDVHKTVMPPRPNVTINASK
jgi:hypothetical protein